MPNPSVLFSRRALITTSLSTWPLVLAPAIVRAADAREQSAAARLDPAGSAFPRQDPAVVQEMVTVAHFNVARVKELVGRQQTLAKAAWDWGYGDWESALGAASHVGNREIAEFLLANGARPSIFSAAMLGQLEVVRAFITAAPGIQRTHGPHSITLLRHATAGGAQAKPVLEYLTSIGGADERLADKPISSDDKTKLAGLYPINGSATDRMEITIVKEQLMIGRTGLTARGLTHLGSFEFYPAGAENVRVRFAESSSGITMTVHDPDVVLSVKKM
jgi:hypothetical protein